jgi:hypothetical protein
MFSYSIHLCLILVEEETFKILTRKGIVWQTLFDLDKLAWSEWIYLTKFAPKSI